MRVLMVGLALGLAACVGAPAEQAAEAPQAAIEKPEWTLLIHGGAGALAEGSLSPEREVAAMAGLDAALEAGAAVLRDGGLALDAVEAAVRVLEDDENFNAGRGAVLTLAGKAEMDAMIMDGRDRNAGAVAQLRFTKNPISAARMVMEQTPHVMFAGIHADALAAHSGLEMREEDYFITERRRQSLQRVLDQLEAAKHSGTVGAVAMDRAGNLAAATSTGGMTAKMPGRVGDSPIVGAGGYADNESCAISSTGHGEYYIRTSFARMVCARVADGMSAEEAAQATLAEIAEMGGDGGAIVIARDGSISQAFNTGGMYRGRIDAGGVKELKVYPD